MMKSQILSRKFIKPSAPTPHHLKNKKISFMDQLLPSVYVPMIFYYPANGSETRTENGERRNRLEKSLSETLTLFYPLAGRFIKDTLSVDCNDQGVEFLEAKMDGQLAQLLHLLHKNPEAEQLSHFFPSVTESDTSPLVAIQINVFNCGGVVIGVRISHRIADGFMFTTFINGWATASRAGINEVITPSFVSSSLFPARDLPLGNPMAFKNNGAKFVTRIFVFDRTAILSLKAKTRAGAGGSGVLQCEATRVEVVMAVIWRALISLAKAKHGHLRPSLLTQPMNLRGKTLSPSIPENCCGNLYRQFNARFTAEDEKKMELHELVGLLGDAKRKTAGECEKLVQGDYELAMLNIFKDLHEEMQKEEVDVYLSTSWCRFPLYEADFGWGKPAWVSSVSAPMNFVFLMDTKCDGIEAWVSLEEKDMLQFQQDPNIVASIS